MPMTLAIQAGSPQEWTATATGCTPGVTGFLGRFTPKAISNVEKGFVMGISPRARVTRQGKKDPRIKQGSKREFTTSLETVSADGFVFPSYLIGKGCTQIFDWYKHVKPEDKGHWAVSPEG